jgi:hypothetical protein
MNKLKVLKKQSNYTSDVTKLLKLNKIQDATTTAQSLMDSLSCENSHGPCVFVAKLGEELYEYSKMCQSHILLQLNSNLMVFLQWYLYFNS